MTTRAPEKSTALRNAVCAVCAGVLLYGIGDRAVFGSGWYRQFLDPDSLAGRIELTIAMARGRPPSPVPEIAVVGNSVLAEGFSGKIGDAEANGRMRFANLAIPASTARSWYYLLRAVDPDARRYRAIVLQAEQYSDEDGWIPLADTIADLHIINALLAPADILDFAFSFQDRRLRFEALRGAILKGYIFKQDVQAFLEMPAKRLENVALARKEYANWIYDYGGHQESLRGMTVDWNRRSVYLPPSVPAPIQENVRQIVLRQRAPHTGDQARFRSRWFGRIVDRYRASGTRIIFVRPPRGPAVNPSFDALSEPSTIRFFARLPYVNLVRAEAFQPLESPEWFWDGLHMNASGRQRFSCMMVHELEPLLGKEDR
jgi:hypothetical protein